MYNKVIITDSDLKPVDEGVEYVIQTEKHILDGYSRFHASLLKF